MVAATVAWGASGKSAADAGGDGVAAGGVDCAVASALVAAPPAKSRSKCESLMPLLRVNHGAGELPEAAGQDVL